MSTIRLKIFFKKIIIPISWSVTLFKSLREKWNKAFPKRVVYLVLPYFKGAEEIGERKTEIRERVHGSFPQVDEIEDRLIT